MKIERAKELLEIAEQSGNMFPPDYVKAYPRETPEERKFILEIWKTKPGFYCYVDVLREYVHDSEPKGV